MDAFKEVGKMAIDKAVLGQLERFAIAFREARERNANESDTVMYLIKFLEEILGFDSLKGEISKELAIRDRYCDVALKIDGAVRLLVECKAASAKGLVEKHIEQAANYASRAGLSWVLLTNGLEWRLFHLTFAEGEGIVVESAFDVNLVDELETNADLVWSRLSLLSRDSLAASGLDSFWAQKKALSPAAVVRALFTRDVLVVLRRELNRTAPARLEMADVFNAIRDILSKEAFQEAAEIRVSKSRKRKRRVVRTNTASGEAESVEIEEGTPEEPSDDPALNGEMAVAGGTNETVPPVDSQSGSHQR